MNKQNLFLFLPQLIPKQKDDRHLWVGVHKCDILVMEDQQVFFEKKMLFLEKERVLSSCYLHATKDTTVLQFVFCDESYPILDIEKNPKLQKKLKFKLLKETEKPK